MAWLALVVVWAILVAPPRVVRADEARIAVAANFTASAQELTRRFEAATGHELRLSFGSTGKLSAQIIHGAPFDALLAADLAHPRRLLAEGHAVPGTEFVYAVGRLVLWSRDPAVVVAEGHALRAPSTGKIALANPVTAPYGAAAVATLRSLNLYDAVKERLVQGDSIAQAFQFVATGNAAAGFVALAQVIDQPAASYWLVPEHLHPRLEQGAVLLKAGADNSAAKEFLAFLRSRESLDLIRRHGYTSE